MSVIANKNIASIEAVNGNWLKPIEWCSQNIKNTDWHYHGEGVFEFFNKIDLTYFLLIWK